MTGDGNFLDDIRLPGMAYAADAALSGRSCQDPRHRHQPREAMPGVMACSPAKISRTSIRLPCAWQAAGVDNNVATPRLLALGEVRQVGDPVAVVVAESVYQANDALEAIEVDFDEFPAVVDSKEAIKPGAPQLHENAPNNIVMHWTCGTDAETVDRALADAEVRVSQSIFNQRLIPTAMEPRGSIGRYDPGTERVHAVGDLPGAARPQARHRRVRARHSGAESSASSPLMSAAGSVPRSSSTSTCRWCSGCRSRSAGR